MKITAELTAAKAKGHTHAVTLDRKGERKLISTHRSYAEACNAIRNGKGNTVYAITTLLAGKS